MTTPNLVVYGLIDPRDGAVRYVGSTDDLRRRLSGHRTDARSTRRNIAPRVKWLRELAALGLSFGSVVFAGAGLRRQATDLEEKWIKLGRAEGWPLTNVTTRTRGMHSRWETWQAEAMAQARPNYQPPTRGCAPCELMRSACSAHRAA